MGARTRAAIALLAAAAVVGGGAGAYAATNGSKAKPQHPAHTMYGANGTKSSKNCPNM